MSKSIKAKKKRKARKHNPEKPDKPHDGFPLFPHDTKRWAKKIKGKLHYFGKWDDPQAALNKFNREWPYLSKGQTPPPVDTGGGCTVQILCNAFLNSKRLKLENGELSERSFRDYYQTCKKLVEQFGEIRRVDDLRPDDFERFRSNLAKCCGTVTLKNTINRCRVVFKYAHDQRLIQHPVSYGQSFNRPSAKAMRKARNDAGLKMFETGEIRRVLDATDGKVEITIEKKNKNGKLVKSKARIKADPVLKAMILLGANCGFGNTDIATLPKSAVNIETGWIDFPRPKTEIHRRVPLWPETVAALREAISQRPKPKTKADDRLCFLTGHGQPWVRVQEKKKNPDAEVNEEEAPTEMVPIDSLSQKFRKLLDLLDINGRRGFYALRHTFETIGGESRDQVAVNAIMGHVDSNMAGVYRERISDERLRAVTETVRKWLWPSGTVWKNSGVQ